MKTISSKLILFVLLNLPMLAFSQTTFKDTKAGHAFAISVPSYMESTYGLNDNAIAQYKCDEKELYTFIIEDSKAELKFLEIELNNAQQFYDFFIKDFLLDLKDRTVSKSKTSKVGANTIIQSDATYTDEETGLKIYYHITIVETPTYFYKVLSYTSVENKEKVRADLDKLAKSIKEI